MGCGVVERHLEMTQPKKVSFLENKLITRPEPFNFLFCHRYFTNDVTLIFPAKMIKIKKIKYIN